MAQVPIIPLLYVAMVLVAFAAFVATLLAVSIYTHLPRRASVKPEKPDHFVVPGVRPLILN